MKIFERHDEPIVPGRDLPTDRITLRGTPLRQAGAGILAAMCLFGMPASAMGADFPPEFELSALDGSNGFALNGVNGRDFSGVRVAGAGDVNNDGIDDVIIGAWAADVDGRENTGQGYVVFGTDQGFPAAMELSALDGSNGFALNGVSAYDLTGIGVAGAGDVNGDGIGDIIIGARGANPNGVADAGQCYVVFGTDQGFPAVLELSALDGSNGFVLKGINEIDRLGFSVAGTGDINGDGFDDVIVGAKEADSNGLRNTGQSFVVYGTNQGFPAALEATALDGSNGFTINGINPGDSSGYSVGGPGDVNGDGIADFIIGARNADPNGKIEAGQSYVVFGTNQGFPATLELSTIDGSNGFILNGVNPGDRAGQSTRGAGDVNGDGINDVIVGARSADPNGKIQAGQSYVVFGTDLGFPATLELSALDGSNGFALNGVSPDDFSGQNASGTGDVNGDGIDDVIVGAGSANPNGKIQAGQSYVVFGTDQGFPAALELSALAGGNGFALNGINPDDFSGQDVSGAGDINGDGIADIIIGAAGAGANGKAEAGQSYVVFGRPLLELAISGACPGNMVIDIAGASPGGSVVILSSQSRGIFTVRAGACAGTTVDLANPVREFWRTADANGLISLTATVASEACGRLLQSADRSTCLTSNLAQVP